MNDRAQWIASRTADLVRDLVDDASVLGLRVGRTEGGGTVIDCGVNAPGSWEAGRRIIEIAHGGLARAVLGVTALDRLLLPCITVDSWAPSASAGRLQVSFPLDEVDPAIRVSGPVCAMTGALGSRPRQAAEDGLHPWGVAVVEAETLPSRDVIDALVRRTGLPPRQLTLVVVPFASPAGATQIAGRLNECILFTWENSLDLDPERIGGIIGSCPVAPVGAAVLPDDMIHYAGRATVWIDGAPRSLADLARELAFDSTPAFGRMFCDLLAEAGGVFERIPDLIHLNKVAQVTLMDRRTGGTAVAGSCHEQRLAGALCRGAGSDDGRAS